MTSACPTAPARRNTESDGKLIGFALWRWFPSHARAGMGDDLRQAGYVALLKAAAGFDPSLGFEFSTYALRAIRRAMRREARRNLTAITEPERPTAPLPVVHPLEGLRPESSIDPADPRAVDPADACASAERVAAVRDALAGLPEPQRRALELREGGASCAAVGETLGVSTDRAGRLENKARAALAKDRRLGRLAGRE